MISNLSGARAVAAHAMAAAAGEMGISFQLAGSLALDVHGALRRKAMDVNLTTRDAHDGDRAIERIAGSLRHSGWQVDVPDLARPARSLMFLGPGQETGIRLTTAVMPEYTREPEHVDGLTVSSLPTCLLRTVQAVQGRRDARDFVDLAALEERLGPESFDGIVTQWLRHVARQAPGDDPARPYQRLHFSLAHVVTVCQPEFAARGLTRAQAETVRDQVVTIAGRLGAAAPSTNSPAKNALQRLLTLPDGELRNMQAAAEALGIDASYVRARLASPDTMAAQRAAAEQQRGADVGVVARAEQRRRRAQHAQDPAHSRSLEQQTSGRIAPRP
ncbi:hypothetical protein ACFU5O_28210 [Streptomyces sp. NPDC057445]|uniref:hypothetical protein n=1 Tax=Streptomyces sp. NPDC057445 TaxID=3346136 RepID=UPI00369ABC38